MNTKSLRASRSPLFGSLLQIQVMLSILVTSVASIRLFGVSTNTAAGANTAIPDNFEADGKFFQYASGLKLYAYMTTTSTVSNVMKLYPVGGSPFTVTIRPYSERLTTVLYGNLMIFYSERGTGAAGIRGTTVSIQLLAGQISAFANQEVDIVGSARKCSTASATEATSSYVYVYGAHDWKYLHKFDLSAPLYSNLLVSPQIATIASTNSYGKTVSLFASADYLTAASYNSATVLLAKSTMGLWKTFNSPVTSVGAGLINNLNENHYYMDIDGAQRIDNVNVLTAAAPSYLFNFPSVLRPATGSTRGRGLVNLLSLQYLMVADKATPEVLLIDKLTFTVATTANFMDGLATSTSSLRGVHLVGAQVHFGRVEAANRNLQQWYFVFDNCTYRPTNQVCSACPTGYYRTNLTADNECILPADFPPRFGVDAPNVLMKPCSAGCASCLPDFAVCQLCDDSSGYYLYGSGCLRVADLKASPVVYQGLGLNLALKKIEACSSAGCLDCFDSWSVCLRCDNSTRFLLASACYSTATVPAGYGLNGNLFQLCQQGSACLDCRMNYLDCLSCNLAAGYFPIVPRPSPNKCFTDANVTAGFGHDSANTTQFVACASPGCVACVPDNSKCLNCGVGFVRFGDTCYTTGYTQPNHGVDSAANALVPCATAGCANCQADFRVCVSCDQLSGYYPLGPDCFTVPTVPAGFGFDSVSAFEACKVQGCLLCSADSGKCNSCSAPLGYYFYESTCYRIAATRDSLALSTPLLPCDSPACSSCDASQKCSACGAPNHHVLLGFCILDSNTPAIVGLDLARPGQFGFCADPDCLDCRADLNTCVQCGGSKILINSQCSDAPQTPSPSPGLVQQPPTTSPPAQTCTLVITKTSYDNINREVRATLVAETAGTAILELFDIVVNIETGEASYLNVATTNSFKHNQLTVKIALNTTVYQSKLQLLARGKQPGRCAGVSASAGLAGVTVKDLSGQLQKSAASAGTSVAVYGTILSVVLTSNRVGVANLLDKLMSSFIWMKVLNGPELLYPRLLLNYMSFKKSAIFGIKNPFDNIGENCDLPAQYERSSIACNFLVNFGDDLIFIAGCFAIGLLLFAARRTFSSLLRTADPPSDTNARDPLVARKATNRVQFKNPEPQKPKPNLLLALLCFVECSIGFKYALNEVHSNLMELLSYAVIHLTRAGSGLWQVVGTVFCVVAVVYFLLLNFVEYKFIRYHRDSLLQSATTKRMSVAEVVEKSRPTVWNVICYAHESSRAPRRGVYLYFLYFEHLRVCLVSTALYFLVRVGVFQVFFAVAMQLAYVVLLVDAREKHSRLELAVACATAGLELVFSGLKLGSFFIEDPRVLEEQVGLWMAIVLGLMVAVNLLLVTWELLWALLLSPVARCCRRNKLVHQADKHMQVAFKGRSDIAKLTTVRSLRKRFPRKTFLQMSSMASQKAAQDKGCDFTGSPVSGALHRKSAGGNRTPTSTTQLINFEASARARRASAFLEEETEVLATAAPLAPRTSPQSPAKLSPFSPSRKERLRNPTLRVQLLNCQPTCSPTFRPADPRLSTAYSPSNRAGAQARASFSPRKTSLERRDSEAGSERQAQASEATLNELNSSIGRFAGKKHPPRPRVSSTTVASKRLLTLNEPRDHL